MKKWKKLLVVVLCISLVLGTNSIRLLAGSETQITHAGKGTEAEGIRVSKTVSGTDVENMFDITLKVETDTEVKKIYEKPPVSVVVVLDISNTMFSSSSSEIPYDEAMASLKRFIKNFYDDSRDAVVPRELSVVTFNTNANTQLKALDCSTTSLTANQIYTDVEAGIKDTLGDMTAYANSTDRFTNIEAGLQVANNILNKASTDNKYVILLTDGMPTTYSKNHTSTSTNKVAGYSPYTSSGDISADGVFYSALAGAYCDSGTSYSDKAAQYAENLAANMKNNGVKIYSVGINIGDVTIESLIDKGIEFVIDSRTTNINKFVIKSTEATKYSSDYQNWLYHEIGSDYYANGDNASQMDKVYDDAFADMTELSEESITTSWRISDPMNNEGLLSKNIEFLGFFNKSDKIATVLTGESVVDGENTATFTTDTEKIDWIIHESGYTTKTSGGVTTYCYELKYRIRLKNELSGFEANKALPTNGTTTLSYIVNENGTIKNGTIDFDIPTVKGYLGMFSFTKTDELTNKPLKGAQFVLVHSSDCSVCKAMNKTVTIKKQKATSDANGKVSFANIPSGHEYEMTESVVPEGYQKNTKIYEVVVSDGAVTIDGVKAESFTTLANAPKVFKLNYVIVTPEADCPDKAKTDATPGVKTKIPYNTDVTLEGGLTTTATKKGEVPGIFKFSGWYETEACTGTPITTKNIKKDETVYGKWEFTPNTYKVNYVVTPDPTYGVPGDTSTPTDSKVYAYKELVDVVDNLKTTWTTSDGTATGYPGTWVFEPWDKNDFNITEDTTIYGAWKFSPNLYLQYVIVSTENPASAKTDPKPATVTGLLPNQTQTIEPGLTTRATDKNGVPGTWTFKGWYQNKELTGTPVTSIVMTKNEIVYGRWDFVPDTYKVTYVVTSDPIYGVPGTTTPVDGTVYNYKDLVVVHDDLITTWETSDGTPTGIPGHWSFVTWDKDDFKIVEDTTIYGAWKFAQDDFTLNYIIVTPEADCPDSAKTDATPATVTNIPYNTDQVIADVLETKANEKGTEPGAWVFSGWFETEDCTGTPITIKNIRKDETVYGKWEFVPGVYKVTYVVRGDVTYGVPSDGIAPVDPINYTYKQQVYVENDLTTAWTTSNGKETGVPGTWKFTPWDKDDFLITRNTTIYGKWTFVPVTYQLEYVIVTTENPLPEKTVPTPDVEKKIPYDTDQKLARPIRTVDRQKDGIPGVWVFGGWYETEDCGGDPITVKNIKKNEIVYGRWDFIPGAHTLNYVIVSTDNPDSDKTDATPKTVEGIPHNTDVDIEDGLTTRDDKNDDVPGTWIFSGWYETEDCGGTPIEVKNIQKDEAVYGKWEFVPHTYTLDYVIVSTENPSDDLTDPTPDTVTEIPYDTDIKIADGLTTTDTELNGEPGEWIFDGWFDTEDCTGTPLDVKNIKQDETVYGKWEFIPDEIETEEIPTDKPTEEPETETETPEETEELTSEEKETEPDEASTEEPTTVPEETVETGDSVAPIVWAFILMVSAVAAAFIFKERKSNE